MRQSPDSANAPTATAAGVAQLAEFFHDNPRVVALTGAGISAASGIPTYRDNHGRWRHSQPIQHREFLADALSRKRYWARSMRGWPPVRDAIPNRAHLALARLEQTQRVTTVITQNVDRLHQRAGSREVVDLHGRLDRVRCLDCGRMHCRQQVQEQLLRLNPPAAREMDLATRPDGDADIPDAIAAALAAPHCSGCGGVLMPDVVFFGGTVPRSRVDKCISALESADALLVVGSSLQVFSGFRFCRRASELGMPIAIINPGHTRADDLATLKLVADGGELLEGVTIND